ncbi:hypothetical protein [Sphingomonas sp. BK235]|uniref:hypothetical protein n=1 Tax=Sphingomonas sp. BK235 TaxID=2512131 RepID=UPI001051E1BF|nr:hypothetical protein [Sphingomonas sp. BK235]TCP33191.1 hypothetical protein EV292_106133 [Sphingomonas sp. BK235]
MPIITITRYVTVAVAVALAALILFLGHPGEPRWWALALPFAGWVIGPSVATYLLARRWGEPRWAAPLLLAALLASSLAAGITYYRAFVVSESSTAALALVFVPLWQWVALACLALAIIAGRGWARRRTRRDEPVARARSPHRRARSRR